MAAVAVFGGSYDPVHTGHLIVAEHALEALTATEIRFVPAREQPFKRGTHAASPEHRLAMLQGAIEDNPRFVVDGIEVARPGPSYTVDTLRALGSTLGERPYLLVGSDAAVGLARWHDAAALPDLAEIVVYERAGVPVPELPFAARRITVPYLAVSARELRARVRAGRTIRYLVPESVRAYIARHQLYQ